MDKIITTNQPAPTPRTDAEVGLWNITSEVKLVTADFARTLERELAAANERVRELEKQIAIANPVTLTINPSL